MLASGGYDSTVALWDIVGDEPVQKLRLQVNMINFTKVLNPMLTKIPAKGVSPLIKNSLHFKTFHTETCFSRSYATLILTLCHLMGQQPNFEAIV